MTISSENKVFVRLASGAVARRRKFLIACTNQRGQITIIGPILYDSLIASAGRQATFDQKLAADWPVYKEYSESISGKNPMPAGKNWPHP
jgi:hypothetical protein